MQSNFSYLIQSPRYEARLLLIKHGERWALNISIGLLPLSTEHTDSLDNMNILCNTDLGLKHKNHANYPSFFASCQQE